MSQDDPNKWETATSSDPQSQRKLNTRTLEIVISLVDSQTHSDLGVNPSAFYNFRYLNSALMTIRSWRTLHRSKHYSRTVRTKWWVCEQKPSFKCCKQTKQPHTPERFLCFQAATELNHPHSYCTLQHWIYMECQYGPYYSTTITLL